MTGAPTVELGRSLFHAELAATPMEPLTTRYPELTAEEAYRIQEEYATLKRGAGRRLLGRKIGATSRAIQTLFSIDTPDFGQLFDDMLVPDGGAIRREELIAPMVEPELAFVLHRDLSGPGITRDDVLAATARVIPCLEIIDSRIIEWRIAFADTVADNGSSARYVLGGAGIGPAELADLDLASVTGTLLRDGEVVARDRGAAVLGHPAEAVAWLANVLGGFGAGLRRGEHVLSGSFTSAIPAAAGQRFTADFPGIGTVGVGFE